MKIYSIGEALADWKEGSCRLVVLRLQNDKQRTVFVQVCTLLGAWCPTHISMAARVILIKVIQFRHQLSGADCVVRRIECHGHVPRTCVTCAGTAGIKDGMRNSAA